jgi:hypothetical protein
MALLADQSGDVNSNLTTGTGTESATYTVPGNVPVKVESVVATITNGSASAVTPEVTIRDQSGVVIARKAQRVTIPAGDTGTATFALRLDDDEAAAVAGQTYTATVEMHACLVHYWPADESSGNLVDRKGSWTLAPVTAVVSGTTYPVYGAGGPLVGQPAETSVVNAGNFGVTGHEARFFNNFGAAAFWTGTAEFTVELWVYLTSYGLVDTATVVQADQFAVDHSSKKLRATRGAVTITDPTACPLNAWQYVIVRYDGTTLELLRNAVLVGSALAGATNISTTLSWMNNFLGPSWTPINGRTAQLAIYDCALTDGEVALHYALATSA